MKEKTGKIIAYIMLGITIASLLPVMYLGRYNHPTGDDYYYGAETKAVWEETGSLAQTAAEAVRGTVRQYRIWQGTYSAMFLMHLPPNIFGESYRFVASGLLLLLAGGIFYLLKPVICVFMGGTPDFWLLASSLLTLLCVQTVDFQGESFFWYNGGVYYTGFYALTLFFFGIALRYITAPRRRHIPLLLFLAFVLAGGNYVSLLPALLILFLLTAGLFWVRSPGSRAMAAVFCLMLVCFSFNVLAPGNRVRQDGMWGIPAWKAILKSLLQGAGYCRAWTGIWLILALFAVTPFMWRAFSGMKFRFRYPLAAVGLAYGIFCSMFCPTFYTMNSTGPARVVAIVYYGYLLFAFGAYGYLLGYVYRVLEKRRRSGSGGVRGTGPGNGGTKRRAVNIGRMAIGTATAVFLVLLGIQIFSEALGRTTAARAVRLLVSGEAAAYEREYQDRLRILEDDSVRDVVFRPYENQPDMLYVGDFAGDPQHETNRVAARYFGKNTICVKY